MDQTLTTIGAQIERLTLEAAGKIVEIDGKAYSTVELHDPRAAEPVPAPLVVSTLTALGGYVTAKQDSGYTGPRGLFVHVVAPDTVRLCTGVFGDHNQRATLVEAKACAPSFPFEQWLDAETFNIMLQARCVDAYDRAAVLALVGNLSTEAVATVEDDGMSQSAKLRAGIVKVAERKVPNPVTLAPRRTFADIVQPESPFVLRLRGGGDGKPPSCGLFEADGGAWRLTATQRIAEAMAELVPADVVIYA